MTEYATRLENGTDTAARMRRADALGLTHNGALNARTGLRPDGGGVVSVVAGSMAVQVTPFLAWINGGSSGQQGGYPFACDATRTLTLNPGHPTLPRIDTVAAVVRDNNYDGSGVTSATLQVIEGTAGGTAPALPPTCVPLRDVVVPAGTSAGTGGLSSSNLGTDRRTYTAATGGVLPVSGGVERDALPAVDGQVVYRGDTGDLEYRRAGRWESLRPNDHRILYATDRLNPTTGVLTMPGLSTTVASPGAWAKWWVDVSLDVARTSTNAPDAVLVAGIGVGSTPFRADDPGSIIWNPGNAANRAIGRDTATKRYLVENLPAGNHVVRVQVTLTEPTGSFLVYDSHSSLAIQRVV